jgi:hypothetical protein
MRLPNFMALDGGVGGSVERRRTRSGDEEAQGHGAGSFSELIIHDTFLQRWVSTLDMTMAF